MTKQRIGALILAAGFSSRIKGFKPLLEIGGKTLIEHAIELFKSSGIDEIVTVVGHRSEELIPVVEAASSGFVMNVNHQDGMFASIQKGAKELQDACDAFFLLPVDIPFVRSATLQQLLDKFFKDPSTLICYPQFQSRRGHPPLIDSSLVRQILTYAGQGGMRGLLKRYEKQAVYVSVDDPFIGIDVDTQEDLFHLKKKLLKHSSGI